MTPAPYGAQPTERTVVVTCMDARIDPLAVLRLPAGGAQVIRNAGGRVSDDALRSLILSTSAFRIERVVVMHHTDCAVAGITNDQMREQLGTGPDGEHPPDFLPIGHPVEALERDVARVLECSFIPGGIEVRSAILDVSTGGLRELGRSVTGAY